MLIHDGKMHIQKTRDSVTFLEDLLCSNPRANAGDRASIENIIKNLNDALGEKPWYSKTNVPT